MTDREGAMKRLLAWLMDINSPDEEECRRGRTIVAITLGLIAIALASIPALTSQPEIDFLVGLTSVSISLPVFLGILALARYGQTTLSALILIASLTLAIVASGLAVGSISPAGYFLVLPVLIASLCLRPSLIWVILALVAASLVLTFFSQSETIIDQDLRFLTIILLLLCMVALLSFLGARSIGRALQAVSAARADAESSAQHP
jgi:hypothetical protein